ncbi:cupin-like domain-containing protein [Parvularcula dongshanensis]|uniref:JmjC domain-containing protein n=1 Tax=Parvularcula dongshanensis TaxID=1173995 RepID=A0A840I5N1_9PROT|nr:cupin-like domain-containing protein [Parvularcula dongshanensis]MBB4659458.1 hypothetical protein [Parvularcula dongshanensis]
MSENAPVADRATRRARTLTPDRTEPGWLSPFLAADGPVVLRGAASDWALVQAGLRSTQDAMALIRRFDAGRPLVCYRAAPALKGRFFYDDTVTAMNFEAGRIPVADFLEEVSSYLGRTDVPSLYVGSTDIETFFPGFRAENDLPVGEDPKVAAPPLVSMWIGNRTTATAHHDMSNNVAVCAVGRRRFTLFPPDQIANLYPGPLEPTPGGQVISMVDFKAPDLERFPRFEAALRTAQVAELEPGDVLLYPAMWWHHVEALDDFNVLVNYWWNAVPAYMDTPMNTLLHGLLSLRDRPEAEKRAWQALFDYYVFGPAERAGAHLPEGARGPLGPMDEGTARRLRRALLAKLNR